LVPFQRSVSARSADLCSFEPTFHRSLIDVEACIFFALIFVEKDTSYKEKDTSCKKMDKEKPLDECKVTPS